MFAICAHVHSQIHDPSLVLVGGPGMMSSLHHSITGKIHVHFCTCLFRMVEKWLFLKNTASSSSSITSPSSQIPAQHSHVLGTAKRKLLMLK